MPEFFRKLSAALLAASFAFAVGAPRADDSGGAEAEVECGRSAARIYREAKDAVVQITTLGIDPFRVAGRVISQSGTGFAIRNGLILTNYHVVAGGGAIAVRRDGQIAQAWVIGVDPLLDIAVLRAAGMGGAAFGAVFALDPGVEAEVGGPAFVIGYPQGGDRSISAGVVSGVGRSIPLNTFSWLTRYIQTDAAVNPGNSGGPLLDDCGRLLGMVTLKGMQPGAENIGFAIPVETLAEVTPELIRSGEVARPWHGLFGQIVTPTILRLLGYPPFLAESAGGFLVETVEPGSAADRAGIKGGTLPVLWGAYQMVLGGDIIISVDGRALMSLEDALEIVRGLKIGEEVEVTLIREGKELTRRVTIEKRPILPQDTERYLR